MSNSGYTFVDNSQLSISEKIKLYFAKNPCEINSANSSTSSLDLDESLLQTLEESKNRIKLNLTKSVLVMVNDIVDLSSPASSHVSLAPLAIEKPSRKPDQPLIDLCTPPPQLIDLTCGMNTVKSTKQQENSDQHRDLTTAKKLDFDSTETTVDYLTGENNIDQQLPDQLTDVQSDFPVTSPPLSKISMLTVSDESFLAMEKWCEEQEDSPNNSPPQASLFKSSFANETHLSDVEEPSELWNLTKYDISPCKKITFNRPSTIIEESTQCSSSNGSNVTDTSSSLSSLAAVNRHENTNVLIDMPKNRENLQLNEIVSFTNSKDKHFDKEKFKLNERATNCQLFLPNKQSNKENFQWKNEIAKTKPPTYRESIFNVFPNNKTKRQYYQSPEAKDSGISVEKLEKNISTMSIDDYESDCQSSANQTNLFNVLSPELSLSMQSEDESNDENRNLNDTIDAVDFFIEQGRKLQSAKKIQSGGLAFSPKTRNCLSACSSQKTMKPRTPTEILRANHLRRNLMDSTMMELFTKDK